jgi:hypothetical protein
MLSAPVKTKTSTSEYFQNYFSNLFTKKRQLTKLELDLIPQVQADWQGILRSTSIDRLLAEDSLKDCYAYAGLAIPNIMWVEHPLAVVKIAMDRPSLRDVSNVIINQIWQSELKIQQSIDPIYAEHVFTSINPQHVIKTRTGIVTGATIAKQSGENVCQRLNELVMSRADNLYNHLTNQSTPTPLQDYRIGDLGYFDYFMQIGLNLPAIKPAIALAKSCGWCWTFEGLAVLTSKPAKIKIDHQGNILGIIYNNVNILNESKQS